MTRSWARKVTRHCEVAVAAPVAPLTADADAAPPLPLTAELDGAGAPDPGWTTFTDVASPELPPWEVPMTDPESPDVAATSVEQVLDPLVASAPLVGTVTVHVGVCSCVATTPAVVASLGGPSMEGGAPVVVAAGVASSGVLPVGVVAAAGGSEGGGVWEPSGELVTTVLALVFAPVPAPAGGGVLAEEDEPAPLEPVPLGAVPVGLGSVAELVSLGGADGAGSFAGAEADVVGLDSGAPGVDDPASAAAATSP